MKKLLYLGASFFALHLHAGNQFSFTKVKLPQDITIADVENNSGIRGTVKEINGSIILDCHISKRVLGRVVKERGGWYLMTKPGHFTLIGEKQVVANMILAHVKAQKSVDNVDDAV